MSSSEWKEYKLSELAFFSYGKMPKKEILNQGKYPTFSGYKYQYTYPEFNCEPGDVIVVARGVGGTGDVKIVKEKCYLTNLSIKINLNKQKVNKKYFYYYYLPLTLRHLDSGSAQSQITIDDLKRVSIILPELHKQDKIAFILSSLDDKIELNRQTNQTLEAIAKALFKEWFVDFNFPGVTGEMHDSELGEIPKGWRVGKLGEVMTVKGGTTPSTKVAEYWDGKYHWATPKDLSALQFPVLLKTDRKITEKGVKQISSGILPVGTLLLSSRAPIGYLAISDIPVSINQGFIAINGTKLSNIFLLCWLKQNMDKIIGRANGSTFLEISKTVFKEIEITIPDKKIIEAFDKIALPLFEQIKNNEEQNQTLIQLRDSLLPKLMKGEINVN